MKKSVNNTDLSVSKEYLQQHSLIDAIVNNKITVVEELVNNGLDYNSYIVNGMFKGTTPLFIATLMGNKPIIKLFLDKGVTSINFQNIGDAFRGLTPLIISQFTINHKVSELLLKNKASLSIPATENSCIGSDPLQFYVNKNLFISPVRFKIRLEPFVTYDLESFGKVLTSLFMKYDKCHNGIIIGLFNNGGDINASINENTLMFLSCFPWLQAETVEFLLRIDADINTRNAGGTYKGQTPLFAVCNLWMIDSIKFLISKKADINARNFDGDYKDQTPLLAACNTGGASIVKLLLAQPEINLDSVAGHEFNEEIEELLVAKRMERLSLEGFKAAEDSLEGSYLNFDNDENFKSNNEVEHVNQLSLVGNDHYQ